MCGIIGYTGRKPAVSIILEGLRRLEYRGYDSSGICFIQGDNLEIIRAGGKVQLLEDKLQGKDLSNARSGLGHIRWATHGAPSEANAHPHKSCQGNLCLVHNGIIENYQQHKNALEKKGIVFTSDTDTEVLVNCIADAYQDGVSLLQAISTALKSVHGAYAIALQSPDEPGVIYAAKHAAPLLLGLGEQENFVASDVPAFLQHTREVVFLDDNEIARVTADSWEVVTLDDLRPVTKTPQTINWDMQAAQKGGFEHFMLKEIYEQPKAIIDCMAGRVDSGNHTVEIPELVSMPQPSRLRIVACGTSYHAGLWAMPFIENWGNIPVTVEIASEFRYRSPLLEPGETILAISQSGETADTLAAMRIAKQKGCHIIGLCNVIGSSIARESDAVIYTQAGPEISVASTKALSSQMVVLMLIAMHWGCANKHMAIDIRRRIINGLLDLPGQLDQSLPAMQEEALVLAKQFANAKSMFFLGRGQAYPLALEGALKVKELTYIHAEGYPAGEIKHGPIALIDENFPTFMLLPHDELFLKSKSNMEEIQARKGPVVAITNPDKDDMELNADHLWVVPDAFGPLMSFLLLPALQLLSYQLANYLGNDVDHPRNLAKSVTVE